MKISAMKQNKLKIILSAAAVILIAAAAVILIAAADIAVYACFCTNCRR